MQPCWMDSNVIERGGMLRKRVKVCEMNGTLYNVEEFCAVQCNFVDWCRIACNVTQYGVPESSRSKWSSLGWNRSPQNKNGMQWNVVECCRMEGNAVLMELSGMERNATEHGRLRQFTVLRFGTVDDGLGKERSLHLQNGT
ncbi:Acid-Sensing Ion Channel 1 [Manis pentadactyla]|nr:Acid-Sensing Ion Channel 1 [Manis pentadactyla]